MKRARLAFLECPTAPFAALRTQLMGLASNEIRVGVSLQTQVTKQKYFLHSSCFIYTQSFNLKKTDPES